MMNSSSMRAPLRRPSTQPAQPPAGLADAELTSYGSSAQARREHTPHEHTPHRKPLVPNRKQNGTEKNSRGKGAKENEGSDLSGWLASIDWRGAPTSARSREVPSEEMTSCSVPVPGEVHSAFKSAALWERNSMTETLIALMHTYAESFSSTQEPGSKELGSDELFSAEPARMDGRHAAYQLDLFDSPSLRASEWHAAIAWEAAPTGEARIRLPKSRLQAIHVKVPLRFHLHFKRLVRGTGQTVTDTFVALMYTYALAKGKL